MRFLLRKRNPGEIEFGIIYGSIVVLALLAGYFLPLLSLAPTCVFKALTGIPCPTCGSTRSLVLLSHGHIVPALFMNPLIGACGLAGILLFFIDLITLFLGLPKISIFVPQSGKDRMRFYMLFLIVANWSYLILAPE